MLEKLQFSRYNVFTHSHLFGLIIFNTSTGALARIDDEPVVIALHDALITNSVATLANIFDKEEIRYLADEGFLVGIETDERFLISTRSLLAKTAKDIILSVMLTLTCNFRCWYCFQTRQKRHLTTSAEEGLINYVRREARKAESLRVDWYGGEPLLRWGQLRRINTTFSEIAQDTDTDYIIAVTTNGYLLDRAKLDYFSGFRVEQFQITLDGHPKIHDTSRPLKNGRPTFARILDNVALAVESGFEVAIRVNVHSGIGVDDIIRLYDILEERGLKNQLRVLLRSVLPSVANPCEDKIREIEDFSRVMMEASFIAAQKGWVVFQAANEMQTGYFCAVDCLGQFIVDPDGNLYKCGEQFVEEERVGAIGIDGDLTINQERWMGWIGKNPFFYSACVDCAWLPICQGGCSMKRKWKGKPPCIEEKYAPDKFLEALVLSEENRRSV